MFSTCKTVNTKPQLCVRSKALQSSSYFRLFGLNHLASHLEIIEEAEAGSKGLTFRIQFKDSGKNKGKVRLGSSNPYTCVCLQNLNASLIERGISMCVLKKYIKSTLSLSSVQSKSSLLCLCKSD